jgi:hypothetical protein
MLPPLLRIGEAFWTAKKMPLKLIENCSSI